MPAKKPSFGVKAPRATAPVVVDADKLAKMDADNAKAGGEPLPAATSKPAATPTSSAKRRAERGEKLTIYLPPELAQEVRLEAIRRRCSVSHAMTEAAQAWLRKTS